MLYTSLITTFSYKTLMWPFGHSRSTNRERSHFSPFPTRGTFSLESSACRQSFLPFSNGDGCSERIVMNIIPTWKNAAYRQSLTAGAQARLSVNPIGKVELTDADLEAVHGAGGDLLSDNNSHNLNVLSGNDILNNNNILNGAVSNIGILGIGSSNSCDGGSG